VPQQSEAQSQLLPCRLRLNSPFSRCRSPWPPDSQHESQEEPHDEPDEQHEDAW
jgi:hypothetical protein